jgi:hypothetical protein
MRAPSWLGGVISATAVWLINAFIVLPTIGKGIAGSRGLTLAGSLGSRQLIPSSSSCWPFCLIDSNLDLRRRRILR